MLFVHQSLFAQVAEIETGSFAYSDFLVVILIILIAAIFIGLEIFGDPKYEYKYEMPINTVSDSIKISEYFFEKSVTTKLKVAVYSACLLLVIYAALVLLMF